MDDVNVLTQARRYFSCHIVQYDFFRNLYNFVRRTILSRSRAEMSRRRARNDTLQYQLSYIKASRRKYIAMDTMIFLCVTSMQSYQQRARNLHFGICVFQRTSCVYADIWLVSDFRELYALINYPRVFILNRKISNNNKFLIN